MEFGFGCEGQKVGINVETLFDGILACAGASLPRDSAQCCVLRRSLRRNACQNSAELVSPRTELFYIAINMGVGEILVFYPVYVTMVPIRYFELNRRRRPLHAEYCPVLTKRSKDLFAGGTHATREWLVNSE